MEDKENIGLGMCMDKNMDKMLTNSTKLQIKTGSINALVSELDMEKEYLSKLKIQRQKVYQILFLDWEITRRIHQIKKRKGENERRTREWTL